MEQQNQKSETEETLECAMANIQKRIEEAPTKPDEVPESFEPAKKKQKQNTKPAELVDMRLASRIIQSSFDHPAAKSLGKNNLLKFLRERNVLHKHNDLKNAAKIEYIEKEYFKTVNVMRMQGETEHVYIKTLVTSTGILYIASLVEAHISEIEKQKEAAQKKTKTSNIYGIDYLAKQAN